MRLGMAIDPMAVGFLAADLYYEETRELVCKPGGNILGHRLAFSFWGLVAYWEGRWWIPALDTTKLLRGWAPGDAVVSLKSLLDPGLDRR
jgi:hypothetical protein